MSKTFDFDADNTSDHQPIILKLDYKTQLSNDQPENRKFTGQNSVRWQ